MSISTSISRFTAYLKRNGMAATARRLGVAAKRCLFAGRMVIFYCDIAAVGSSASDLPSFLIVERHRTQADVSPQDLQKMIDLWNPKLARRNLEERFGLGASLWLIKFEGQLAGYGWTLQGRTVEPHYFPLGEHDVQFLDFHVFPKFRGRGIDCVLMNYILSQLSRDCGKRAYGEAAEWNTASLASFAMARFIPLGKAKKFVLFGRTVVWWSSQAVEQRRDARRVYLGTRSNRPSVPRLG